jgi:2-oxoglutarate dehydrogenase E2 component (dihydrolipoamide succinyltransferase)
MANVTMPQLGETVADGTVTKWFKKVGDAVVKGEPLFEVSTDKVDTEIPSPTNGILSAILVDEGVTVDVGTVLAVIGDGTEEPIPVVADKAVPTPPTASGGGAVIESSPKKPTADQSQLSPVVRRLIEENDLDVADITGTGPNGRVTRQDVLAAIEAMTASSGPVGEGAQSPIVRRLMSEHSIDAKDVVGTGPNGSITRHDVDAVIAAGPSAASASGDGDQRIPFSKIRRLTAEHMVRSKATSAHTLMVKEVDYEHVELARARYGAAFKDAEGFGLNYLPFNAIAVIEALRDFPHLNASVGDDELIIHRGVNLGIAVDIDNEGLVVPVLRGADQLNLRQIARGIRDVAERARSKHLGVDDLKGGTFTISNPGPFGTTLTGAIINQPQVAILSTDAVVRKPVVITAADGTESVGIHSVGMFALTFDHRAVDGAYAARFLRRMEETLTTRDWDSDLVTT